MILDKRNEFCDAVALNTGAAGTYNIGDIIDLGTARDLGGDQALYLVVTVDTTATSGGSATGTFRLVSDATESISTTTASVHAVSSAVPVASMTAGTVLFAVQLPVDGVVPYERYVGVQQLTGTAAFTAGKVNAFLTTDVARWKAYDAPFQL